MRQRGALNMENMWYLCATVSKILCVKIIPGVSFNPDKLQK